MSADPDSGVRVAHLGELHLGGHGPGGGDSARDRQGDLEAAFHRAVDAVVRSEPALVLILGDLFDHPAVPARPLGALVGGLWRLREALPDVDVALVAGARDVTFDRGPASPPLELIRSTCPWVHVAVDRVETMVLARSGIRLVMAPYPTVRHAGGVPDDAFRADPDARWNVLATYGRPRLSDRGPIRLSDWDYVALGDGHRNHHVAANLWVAGSLERVGPAPWGEVAVDKGFVVYDLEGGAGRFHTLPTRPVVTLAAIRAAAGDRSTLARRIREAVDGVPGGLDGKIVRMRFDRVPLGDLVALEASVLEPLRRQAFHLSLDLGAPPRSVGRGRDAPSLSAASRGPAAARRSGVRPGT